jgi:Undecaprenyl-phosphate glucose phosphotransferase
MIGFDAGQMVRNEVKAASADVAGSHTRKIPELSAELSEEAKRIAQNVANNPVSIAIFSGILRAVELGVLAMTGMLVYVAYLGVDHAFNSFYAGFMIALPVLTIIIYQALGLYKLSAIRDFSKQVMRLFGGWTLVFLFALAAIFFMKSGEEVSRVWLAGWYVSGIATVIAFRLISNRIVKYWTRTGRLERRAVIVGGGKPAEELIEALTHSKTSDIKICGIFDDREDDRSPESCAGYPKLGNVSNLVSFARQAHIDLLIVTIPVTAESRLLQMLKKLWVLPVDIRLSAHTNRLKLRPRVYSYIGDVPFLDIFDKPIADWDIVAKWCFDKIIGGLALLILSPIMLATAIAIKLDSKGPVFFRQDRFGFNNDLIKVYKFRSMYVDQCDARANKLVTKDDPRVTPVGRFIRKTSIDELPQLFNVVFAGNLSLCGPRPHALSAKAAGGLYQDVVDGYFARHKVKPGITGWAQINGWRGETDTYEKIQKRVEHDLYYIENWSILLDLYILMATPASLVSQTENAY